MRKVLVLLCLLPALAGAEILRLDSRPGQVSMLELYTSQGCSSCPPADSWLSGLVDDPRLWTQLIPIALHVDYWNYLGWSDPFAREQHSQRQRDYARSGHLGSVYTPGFVVNGREWRGWWGSRELPATRLQGGTLHAEWQDGQLAVEYERPEPGLRLHVALLGFDLETSVKRGENRDRQLRENFVVLRHRQQVNENGRWRLAWPDDPTLASRRALVLWLSRGSDSTPLQAVGGWLP